MEENHIHPSKGLRALQNGFPTQQLTSESPEFESWDKNHLCGLGNQLIPLFNFIRLDHQVEPRQW